MAQLGLYELLAPQILAGFQFPEHIDTYLSCLYVTDLHTSVADAAIIYSGTVKIDVRDGKASQLSHQAPGHLGTLRWNDVGMQFRLTIPCDGDSFINRAPSAVLGLPSPNPLPNAARDQVIGLQGLFNALGATDATSTKATDYPGLSFRLELLVSLLTFHLSSENWQPGQYDPATGLIVPKPLGANEHKNVRFILPKIGLVYEQGNDFSTPLRFSMMSWGDSGFDASSDLLEDEVLRMDPPIALNRNETIVFGIEQLGVDFSADRTPEPILAQFGIEEGWQGFYCKQVQLYLSQAEKGWAFNVGARDLLVGIDVTPVHPSGCRHAVQKLSRAYSQVSSWLAMSCLRGIRSRCLCIFVTTFITLFLGWTQASAQSCGGEGQPGCGFFRLGCNSSNLISRGGICIHPDCGRDGQARCGFFVRVPSCDDDLVEFDGVCRVRGACGAEGQRRCLAGEPGTWQALTGCSPNLVSPNNVCTHPNCGRDGEAECGAAVRIPSCDGELVAFDGVCRVRGACGAEGQRRCLAGEPGSWLLGTGCVLNLVPQNNVCTHPNCGRVDERACAIVGRKSCDDDFVEFNNICRERGVCGTEGRRRCLAGEPGAWEPLTGCATTLVPANDTCLFPNNSTPRFPNDSIPRRHNIGFPVRGTVKWSVLLCRYKDQPIPNSKTSSYYERFLSLRGTNGVPDYLNEVSRGLFAQDMSIHGWFEVDFPFSQLQERKMRIPEPDLDDCMEAARLAGFVPPPDDLIMVLPPSDLGARPHPGYRVLVPPVLDGLLHEMFHVYGLVDNFAHVVFDYGDPQVNSTNPGPLVYGDPFDIMSWNVGTYSGNQSSFGGTDGPRFNGFTLDRFGWLSVGETATFGAAGETSRTYTLTPLYARGQGGTRIVRVPFDIADPRHYYQIELRDSSGRDVGLSSPKALIYEIKRNHDGRLSATSNSVPESYLLRNGSNGPQTQTISANGVSITVDHIAADGSSAQVTIRSDFAKRCRLGSVWRVAGPNDLVCVDGASRDRVARENQLAADRREPGGGAFGPDTCRQGFVWRGAFPNDHVCVDGAARDAAAAENSEAFTRTNPARLTVGPNMCKDGFVWRLIDPFDYVCVTPPRRDEAQEDNRLDSTRRLQGGGACLNGFIERSAFAGDKVCVTSQASIDARLDSSAAWDRNYNR